MMRTATSRAARGIAAVMLTALATAGAFTAVVGSAAPASGDAVVVAGGCLDPQSACWVNGWQEKPGT
ncbi:hypothetical protein [Streptomyces exfoliatus]|uniref:hypothetical protein n=1 Tax=Streptomyces exfoliatus TaxID=1905 RepID=UPI0004C50609|nr:hypothetical protein [Streptomyces exfoliatus]